MLKSRRKRGRLSMTSLIDVIFLLLLFFMLTSTFTKFAEVELFAQSDGANAEAQEAPPLFLRTRQSALTLNAVPATLETLSGLIAEQRSSDTAQRILVSLDAETTAQRLTDLLVILRQIPSLQVAVLGATS
jgi:biopolymer transport protein ExbD